MAPAKREYEFQTFTITINMKTLLTFAACLCAVALQAQTQIIAHRGFFTCEGSAPNSLTSVIKAGELGVHGAEFDVHATADKVLVVNHDGSIGGHGISTSKYNDIKDLKLSNGETLPTFEQVLDSAKRFPDMLLVIEIKPTNNKEWDRELTDLVVAQIRTKRIEHRVKYISFSLDVLDRLLEITPDNIISYLNGDKTPAEMHAKGMRHLDYSRKVWAAHPEWVKEAHALGMKCDAWTLNDEANWSAMYDLGIDYLETDHPDQVKKWLEKKQKK